MNSSTDLTDQEPCLKGSFFVVLAFPLLFGGCRSEIALDSTKVANNRSRSGSEDPPNTTVNQTPEKVPDEPQRDPAGLVAEAGQYQTRQTIRLKVGSNLSILGETMTLLEVAGGVPIIEVAIAGSTTVGSGYAVDYSLPPVISLFPTHMPDRLPYGPVNLRLVTGGVTHHFADATFVIADFPLLGMATTRFVAARQTEAGFQGSFESLGGKVKARDGGILVLGGFNMMNR